MYLPAGEPGLSRKGGAARGGPRGKTAVVVVMGALASFCECEENVIFGGGERRNFIYYVNYTPNAERSNFRRRSAAWFSVAFLMSF